MNDRFKFRLWDKENKTYYVSPYGSFALSDSGELFWIESNCDCSELNTSDYVVEQCTGINDANGKLIFEGDIVREINKKEPENEEYITVVKYSLSGYNLYNKDDFDFIIIGNIHENPELLK